MLASLSRNECCCCTFSMIGLWRHGPCPSVDSPWVAGSGWLTGSLQGEAWVGGQAEWQLIFCSLTKGRHPTIWDAPSPHLTTLTFLVFFFFYLWRDFWIFFSFFLFCSFLVLKSLLRFPFPLKTITVRNIRLSWLQRELLTVLFIVSVDIIIQSMSLVFRW